MLGPNSRRGEVLALVQAGGQGSRMDVLTRERAKPWRPYRAYAVLHLWRATMAKPS